MAVAGQCQRATVKARSITEPDRRAEVLVQVTAALSAIGQREEAEAAARSVDNPGHQPQALAEAALALARAGHTGNARRLTAAACATGEWTVAAGPALLLDPSANAAAMAMLQMR
jgi:3,4-dihydroxy-2-butanone 4-phosphate synthase